MPKFVARDLTVPGQTPNFQQIRVYELTDDCTGRTCPVMWDVSVAEDHSPSEFVYGGFPGFGSSAPRDTISSAGSPDFTWNSLIVRSPPTRFPLCEQSSSDDVQIRQGRRHFQAVQVLRQAPITDLAEPKDVLDDAEHVLDLGADPRLVAIFSPSQAHWSCRGSDNGGS